MALRPPEVSAQKTAPAVASQHNTLHLLGRMTRAARLMVNSGNIAAPQKGWVEKDGAHPGDVDYR